jgi:hypothetical protein
MAHSHGSRACSFMYLFLGDMHFHRHNSALQVLDLLHNEIGDAGAAAIGELLRCVNVHADELSWSNMSLKM